MLKTIADEISQHIKVTTPEPDERGHFVFSFNDGLEVTLQKLGDSYVMSSPISTELKEGDDEQLPKMLQWQLARVKETDEVLSFDPDSKKLFLYKQLPPSKLSEKPVTQHLEDFLNNLEYWNSASKDGSSGASFVPTGMLPQ